LLGLNQTQSKNRNFIAIGFVYELEVSSGLSKHDVKRSTNMKKVLLSGLVVLGFGFNSIAQDGAAQVFELAKATHGGAALENMKTYRDAGNISYFDEKGQVIAKIGFRQTYDFSTSRVRIELLQDKKTAQIYQTTPTEAWSWTEQSGVLRLPAAQAKPFRDSLSQGIFAFRAKVTDLTGLKSNGMVKIGDVDGTSLEFAINGIVNKPVIAADGTIIGGSETLEGMVVQSASSDYRTVGGVKLAFSSVTSAAGKIAFDLKVDTAEVNLILSDADFARPK
jgi:hypothetical protein